LNFECWILNWWRVTSGADFGLADEESFQRILNQGLSQRLQQGEWRDKKILDFGFWILNVGLAVLLRASRLRRDEVIGNA
jgi:hypothetical protein